MHVAHPGWGVLHVKQTVAHRMSVFGSGMLLPRTVRSRNKISHLAFFGASQAPAALHSHHIRASPGR